MLNGQRQLAGIVSERDYCRKVILMGRNSHGTRVRDIMTASVADSLGKTGLIQKFRSPETASLPAQYVDPEGFWVSIRTIWTGVGWNTKQIAKADEPKTWEDFLDPKWRGKICTRSGQHAYNTSLIAAFVAKHGEVLDAGWWRALQERLGAGDLVEVLPYHPHRVRVASSI